MKLLDNINFCKIKKITAIELSVILLALVGIGIYYSPNFMNKQEVMMAAKIKADGAIFTSKALEEFAANSNIKPSQVAQKVAGELNLTTQNPYNKKAQAYTFETTCKGCNSVEFDDKANMIILTTYNNKGELMARTVIKPPSFVVYSKGE
ncbi:MAG: hypothetical protein IJ003_02475 [Candidatus Gastranaerophilales bacterium]|nr:hypothetical protein [Candidatus Gastranaerophilales bacterium]